MTDQGEQTLAKLFGDYASEVIWKEKHWNFKTMTVSKADKETSFSLQDFVCCICARGIFFLWLSLEDSTLRLERFFSL
jgi:hypothetical protein